MGGGDGGCGGSDGKGGGSDGGGGAEGDGGEEGGIEGGGIGHSMRTMTRGERTFHRPADGTRATPSP